MKKYIVKYVMIFYAKQSHSEAEFLYTHPLVDYFLSFASDKKKLKEILILSYLTHARSMETPL